VNRNLKIGLVLILLCVGLIAYIILQPEPIFTSATVAGGPQQMLYRSGHNLYIYDQANDAHMQLTDISSDDQQVVNAAWSHDGTQIAFTLSSGDEMVQDLFLLNLETGESTALLTEAQIDPSLTWTPDDSRLSWEIPGPAFNGVFSLALDEGQPQPVRIVADAKWHTWSPDGLLTYVQWIDAVDTAIWALVEGNPRGLVHDELGTELPKWSLSGDYLAYQRHFPSEGGLEAFALVVTDAVGNTVAELGDVTFNEYVWSPTADMLLYFGLDGLCIYTPMDDTKSCDATRVDAPESEIYFPLRWTFDGASIITQTQDDSAFCFGETSDAGCTAFPQPRDNHLYGWRPN
jgi:hypothetical protein